MGTLCSIDSGSSNAQDAVENAPYVLFDRSKKIKRSTRYLFDTEALIIPGEGTEFLPRHFVGKFDLHQRAYALHNFSKRIDVRYLYYYLIYLKDYFPRVAVGATVKSLRRRHFENLPVTVAPRHEQRHIVAVLDETFAGLAIASANAEKNLKNARELFESHLNSALAQARKAPITTLSSVSERVTVGHVGITSPYYRSQGVLFLRTQNVSKTGLLLDDVKYITKEFHESSRKSRIQPGDVLISRVVSDSMNCALVPPDFEEANCANVILVRPGEKLNSQFLLYCIRSATAQHELLGRRKGSAQQVVNTQVLKEWNIGLPQLSDQLSLVRKLEETERYIGQLTKHYERKIESLFELKQSILQKAFSGELTSPPSRAIKEAAE